MDEIEEKLNAAQQALDSKRKEVAKSAGKTCPNCFLQKNRAGLCDCPNKELETLERHVTGLQNAPRPKPPEPPTSHSDGRQWSPGPVPTWTPPGDTYLPWERPKETWRVKRLEGEKFFNKNEYERLRRGRLGPMTALSLNSKDSANYFSSIMVEKHIEPIQLWSSQYSDKPELDKRYEGLTKHLYNFRRNNWESLSRVPSHIDESAEAQRHIAKQFHNSFKNETLSYLKNNPPSSPEHAEADKELLTYLSDTAWRQDI